MGHYHMQWSVCWLSNILPIDWPYILSSCCSKLVSIGSKVEAGPKPLLDHIPIISLHHVTITYSHYIITNSVQFSSVQFCCVCSTAEGPQVWNILSRVFSWIIPNYVQESLNKLLLYLASDSEIIVIPSSTESQWQQQRKCSLHPAWSKLLPSQ